LSGQFPAFEEVVQPPPFHSISLEGGVRGVVEPRRPQPHTRGKVALGGKKGAHTCPAQETRSRPCPPPRRNGLGGWLLQRLCLKPGWVPGGARCLQRQRAQGVGATPLEALLEVQVGVQMHPRGAREPTKQATRQPSRNVYLQPLPAGGRRVPWSPTRLVLLVGFGLGALARFPEACLI
jgi:hypothetical protein